MKKNLVGPNVSPKIPKIYLAKKKKHSYTAWQGFIQHVCKQSASISKKRSGHWMLNRFEAMCLNQPV